MIEVDNLFFSYGAAPVLEEVSFRVEKGEFIALFGPNGGGKSTLLQLLMGFLRPTSGKITIEGKKPKTMQEHFGWVPQTFSFDAQFPINALEVVLTGTLRQSTLFGSYSKEERMRAREVLEQVGMEKFAHAPFGSLSGGQAQRVLIARALVGHPDILFLDEPTASVDQEAKKIIHAILSDLKGAVTILMVTHGVQMATEQADRLMCVQRKLEVMSKEQVCEHFALGLYH